MDDYLTKPIRKEPFLCIVNKWLDVGGRRREAAARSAAAASSNDAPSGVPDSTSTGANDTAGESTAGSAGTGIETEEAS